MGDKFSISRRKFLAAGAVASAGTMVGTPGALGLPRKAAGGVTPFSNYTGDALLPPNLIGMMLYTVRDQVESKGFGEVFETLAAMGYNAIEFAGYTQGTGEITLKQIRKLMDANGLTPVGSHGNLDDAAIKAAVALDMPYTGTAIEIPRDTTTAGWEQLAADYNAFGKKAAKHGVKGYLHPHGPAFAPVADDASKRGLDILIEQTDPKVWVFEMDIYWAYYFIQTFPGYDPVSWVKQHRDRFPLFHVKDGIHDDGEPEHRDVGQGNIPFEEFFSRVGGRRKSWYLNERDNAADHPQGSFCSAQASYLFMRYGLRR